MSHETPEPPIDLFNEIVSREWRDWRLWEKIDAGVLSVLERAKQLEQRFNQSGRIDDPELLCELAELNEEWDALGYNNRFDTFGVTGRLRSAEDEETDEIEHIIQANLGLRPAEIGLDGDYYPASGYRCQIDSLFVRQINNDFEGIASLRIYLAIETDSESGEYVSFEADIGDIVYIDVPYPTHTGAMTILREYYPDMMQSIKRQLPHRCDSENQMLDALDKLILTLDPDALHSSTPRETLLRHLERHISEHLGFDRHTEHIISVDGTVYATDTNGNQVSRDMRGQARCLIDGVKLVQLDDSGGGDLYTFAIDLEASIRLPGRSGGWMHLQIPTGYVEDLRCDHLSELDFTLSDNADIATHQPDRSGRKIERIPAMASPAGAIGELAVMTAVEAEVESTETHQQYLDRHRVYLDDFAEMRQQIKKITKLRYDSEEQAMDGLTSVGNLLSEFMNSHPLDHHPVALVSGSAVCFSPAKFDYEIDHDNDTMTATYTGINTVRGDVTTAKPVILGAARAAVVKEDDQYQVTAFIDCPECTIPMDSSAITDPDSGVPLLTLSGSRRAVIDLSDSDLRFNFKILEQAESRKEALAEIDGLEINPSLKQLIISSLDNFGQSIEQASSTSFTDYEAVTDLNRLAQAIAGDPVLSETVATAMSRMLGSDTMAVVSGAYTDNHGHTDYIEPRLLNIVSVISRDDGPALLIEVKPGGDAAPIMFVMPLSELKALSL